MILHTINKAASHTTCNQQLFIACSNTDSVLLIEDGAYQLLDLALFSSNTHWSSKAKAIYVLSEDATARGLDSSTLDASLCHIEFISYEGFVTLAASHNNTISWY